MAESKSGKTSSPSPFATFPRHLGTPCSTALLFHLSAANLLHLIPFKLRKVAKLEDFLDSALLSQVSYQLSFTKKVLEAVPMSHKKEVRDFEWPIDELKMLVDSDKEVVNVKDDSNLIEEFGNDGDGEACTPVSAFQANQNAAFQRVRISKHWTLLISISSSLLEMQGSR
ncbi:hypothetical protein C1H46_011552 [Malus baccata]|uniref:Uncharacterized protein n=1 Tax=Malus baccata TaxID=106549 RepID=A0A540MX29_MALBA|nr:hypothetical protein C1H46_011552 [Malus baccata]